MKTLRLSAAALLISLTGFAGAAMAQQTSPQAPPASSPAPTFDPAAPAPETPAPQADSATSAATPASATVADERKADAPAAAPDTRAKPVKKHKKPAPEQRSPDAPTPQ